MKICITAANCFIGLPLVKKASSVGWEVKAVVREGCKAKKHLQDIPNVEVYELNLENYGAIGTVVGTVDCSVLLAWDGTRGLTRFNDELQSNNYYFNMEAIKSLVSAGCRRIITAGSQAEYGVCNDELFESSVCNPNTSYGKYKLKLFEEASKYCYKEGVSLKEPRFFSLYGPGDYDGTMIMATIRDMLENRPCKFTLATQMWDYLFIDDAIDALVMLCEKNCQDGVYNFGSGDCRPLKNYIEELKLVLKSNSNLLFGDIPYGPAGIVSIHPSVEKLKRETGWKPATSFKDGIKRIITSI